MILTVNRLENDLRIRYASLLFHLNQHFVDVERESNVSFFHPISGTAGFRLRLFCC